ncbi:hypothetical protein M0805_006263 [Coniferiporia weirii]|nr:hypothetical protein M0805_006263 [Coniferiporia weirii]
MPAIRTDRTALHRDMELLTLDDAGLQQASTHNEFSLRKCATPTPSSPSSSRLNPPTSTTKPTKRKKSSNAFILFRSHAIVNKMLPKTVTHQNDVSRMVAELWRAQDSETRAHFFRMAAEEKLKCMMEDGVEIVERKKKTRAARPAQKRAKESRAATQIPTPPPSPRTELDVPPSPALSSVSSSSSGSIDSSSSLRYPISPVDMHLPALPRVSPLELPADIASPSLAPFEPEADIYTVDPESDFSSYAFEWSATLPASSLSLKQCDSPIPADNALDLYFGPSNFESGLSGDASVGSNSNPYPDFLYGTLFPLTNTVSPSMIDNGFADALLDLAAWSSSEFSQSLDFGFASGSGALF